MTRRNHSPTGAAPTLRAKYVIEENDFMGKHTVLRDIGHSIGFMTITNDVDNVVATLLRNRTIAPGGRLFYFDSDGEYDEIVYDADGFVRFAPGPRGEG